MSEHVIGRFDWQPATIRQTADGYYVLESPGMVPMGGTSKSRLTAWAKTHGFKVVSVTDARPTPMRVEHGL